MDASTVVAVASLVAAVGSLSVSVVVGRFTYSQLGLARRATSRGMLIGVTWFGDNVHAEGGRTSICRVSFQIAGPAVLHDVKPLAWGSDDVQWSERGVGGAQWQPLDALEVRDTFTAADDPIVFFLGVPQEHRETFKIGFHWVEPNATGGVLSHVLRMAPTTQHGPEQEPTLTEVELWEPGRVWVPEPIRHAILQTTTQALGGGKRTLPPKILRQLVVPRPGRFRRLILTEPIEPDGPLHGSTAAG